jgi:hypothetical protein
MIVTVGEGAETAIQDDLVLGDGGAVGGAGGFGGGLQMIDFKLPPPKEFSEEDRDLLIRESVTRIWTCGSDFAEGASERRPVDASDGQVSDEAHGTPAGRGGR